MKLWNAKRIFSTGLSMVICAFLLWTLVDVLSQEGIPPAVVAVVLIFCAGCYGVMIVGLGEAATRAEMAKKIADTSDLVPLYAHRARLRPLSGARDHPPLQDSRLEPLQRMRQPPPQQVPVVCADSPQHPRAGEVMRKFSKDAGALIVIAVIAITIALYAVDFIDSFHMSHAPEMSTCQ